MQVAREIEYYSIKFFTEYESNEALLARLRQGICPGCTSLQRMVVHAMVANHLGYTVEAVEACKAALSNSNVPGFSERVVSLAQKLGLPVS